MTIFTEGAPIIVADIENYSKWLPHSAASPEIKVLYMGDMKGMPKHLNKGQDTGRIEMKFKKLDEAEEFEQEVVEEFEKANPDIKRDPSYKGAPIYNCGGKRIFSCEKLYTTYYNKMSKQLKADFKLITFGRKNQAIFLDTMGGGPKYLHVDEKSKSFSIFAGLSQIEKEKAWEIFSSSQNRSDSIKVQFNGPIVFADSALSFNDFKDTKDVTKENTIDFINKKISQRSHFNLIAEGYADTAPSGIIFSNSDITFECFYRKINVSENQFIFGLVFNLVKE